MSSHGVLPPPTGDLDFEMFLDQETFLAFFPGTVPWLAADGWKCPGIDNTLFSDQAVPMKVISPDHRIALQWFARAHRRGHIRGLPRYLLTGSMPAQWALAHMLANQITLIPERDGVAFKCLMNVANYPALTWTSFVEFEDVNTQNSLLTAGLSLLTG